MLLTRLPLTVLLHPFDLHVLSLPPAFVLSQDQTLKFETWLFRRIRRLPENGRIAYKLTSSHVLSMFPSKLWLLLI